MKRSIAESSMESGEKKKMKRIIEDGQGGGEEEESGLGKLDENLLFEVMKHVDARTLGRASCVSKLWYRTAQDERLWELICTRHWNNIGCPSNTSQLRSVVLALGGFRRLHSLYLWPLSRPQSSSSAAAPLPPPPLAPVMGSKTTAARWGKDEVHLSLSLLSIRYYEKMNYGNRNR